MVNRNQIKRVIFKYDRYGNRTTHNKFIGTSEVTQTDETRPEIDAAKNRFKPTEGYTFDANGNIVVDFTGRQFTFNGDNKQTQVKDGQNRLVGKYFYDGEGKRVKKLTYDQYGVEKDVTVFVYSNGKLIAEYTTEAPPTNPTTRFTITDQLGSPRVILDSAGDVISRRDFLPFGEEIDPDTTYRTDALKYGRTDKVRQKFTGYQNDAETGLDFAEARMYENRHGRFTAVDPLLASGKSADPQTFNRYVYVMNNPIALVDPDGLCSKPQGLKAGQVGICVEAFIAAKRINGVGHGDGRGHDGSTPGLSTRMRTSFIVDAKETSITYDEKIISPSSAGIPTRIAISTGGGPVISGDAEIPLGTLQATGRIEVSGSGTNNPETGDFGETTVNVSFREGANGFQALGKDLQEGAFVARQVGKVVETVAPPGTIDLNATIKITGGGANINVSAPSREARPFPSYTGYAYYYGADGKLVTQKLFYRDETVPADLPKPMTPIP